MPTIVEVIYNVSVPDGADVNAYVDGLELYRPAPDEPDDLYLKVDAELVEQNVGVFRRCK